MKTTVKFHGKETHLWVENGALATVKDRINLDRKVLIVTDDEMPEEYIKTLQAQCPDNFIATIHAGEASKCFIYLQFIWNAMLDNNFGQKDLIIALGGGVVSDIAGFAAATYMRGMDYINIPTTTMSQCDSAIGGKTAINLGDNKNAVGAYHQPKAVIVDPELLKTLDDKQFFSGLASAIRIAAVADKKLFELLETLPADKDEILANHMEAIITACLKAKSSLVSADEKEDGKRLLLTFGETIGNAVACCGELHTFTQGEALAIGMAKITDNETVKARLVALFEKFGLPTTCEYHSYQLLAPIFHDKTLVSGKISLVKVDEIGKGDIKKTSVENIKNYL